MTSMTSSVERTDLDFKISVALDTIHISLLHSKYPYLIIRSVFLIFAIYRSKVNTSLKNKICFENIYFPSKFIKLCPESLKEHTDKISLMSDETQTFYWSFKYMSNYHLKTSLKNKICFENIYFPSKFIKLCPESRKEHTDKISLRSVKHKHFIEVSNIWWSVINYHLNGAESADLYQGTCNKKVQTCLPHKPSQFWPISLATTIYAI